MKSLKYQLYSQAVQSPDVDVRFFTRIYKEQRNKNPNGLQFREDFCGTFALCCEWVKLNKNNTAIGVDLDIEPIEYGINNYMPELSEDQKSRVEILHKNVLSPKLPKADIIGALNFSYFLFKKRSELLTYFKSVYRGLKKDGIFILDVFGGKLCQGPYVDKIKHKGFTYFWDQKGFDPVTHEAQFSIHFLRKGRLKKDLNVFQYDWRMWGILELKEILEEAQFKFTQVYWEGSNRKGEGSGIFRPVDKGEECLSWVAYIAAMK